MLETTVSVFVFFFCLCCLCLFFCVRVCVWDTFEWLCVAHMSEGVWHIWMSRGKTLIVTDAGNHCKCVWHICTRMHVCILYIFYTLLWCMYAYMLHSTQINTCIHVYIYIYIYILFLCAYMYTPIYIYIHIYIYMHTCSIWRRKHTELPCITPHSCIHLYICDISRFIFL